MLNPRKKPKRKRPQAYLLPRPLGTTNPPFLPFRKPKTPLLLFLTYLLLPPSKRQRKITSKIQLKRKRPPPCLPPHPSGTTNHPFPPSRRPETPRLPCRIFLHPRLPKRKPRRKRIPRFERRRSSQPTSASILRRGCPRPASLSGSPSTPRSRRGNRGRRGPFPTSASVLWRRRTWPSPHPGSRRHPGSHAGSSSTPGSRRTGRGFRGCERGRGSKSASATLFRGGRFRPTSASSLRRYFGRRKRRGRGSGARSRFPTGSAQSARRHHPSTGRFEARAQTRKTGTTHTFA